MIIVTTESIPGKEIKGVIGYVKGSTIQAKHVGKDILAGLKTLVGGEIKEYTEMMNQARQIAIGRMVEEAEKKGANAIVGFRLHSSAVMAGAAEIIAYGTAVTID
ncbi:YbjQ family protein [Ammoniphilus sp. CFH 90114]|uniref:YbjQ family protein n=1 Tax=Ammoniphilus sp. CFH 90114 TaxID=2493665 RepID=UPI00100F3594|nr:YbjQ family protein [Ammoniphilus sp. CFH 90114]RXT06247.1 heavy metal-binding domain-containing protein [Ammoniphilus sp. CFH 90114]